MNSQLPLTQLDRSEYRDEDDSTFRPCTRLIRSELEWFNRPQCEFVSPHSDSQVALTRWLTPAGSWPIELSSSGGDNSYVLTFFIGSPRGKWFFGGKPFFEGQVPLNSLWIKEPFQQAHAIYYGSSTSFRVYLPQSLISECYEAAYGRRPNAELICSPTKSTGDRILNRLVRMLIDVDDENNSVGPLFLDGISLALASRLIALDSKKMHLQVFDKEPSALAKWRLNRAIDYIEANLFRPIYLIELSNAVGLSRMHFAAQFRAATGYTPNQYVLRRKVAHSQTLLRDPSISVVDVALNLAFGTQAHFTVVFKSIVGSTPANWRKHVR
ncbi:AraC family transcriptional regulator [Granulicella mallensis]|uniref:AraC-like DNA-binding protein n=1 Tax=Granulicella mallensis TaxID=940614 RepID=A0A7W7ZN83_9BACT|nr:AraC family transcriptional regulator [Granulicella mallensis]MBB5063060.1 AraC-like DNA-binding protein [Granulicella mallensis]